VLTDPDARAWMPACKTDSPWMENSDVLMVRCPLDAVEGDGGTMLAAVFGTNTIAACYRAVRLADQSFMVLAVELGLLADVGDSIRILGASRVISDRDRLRSEVVRSSCLSRSRSILARPRWHVLSLSAPSLPPWRSLASNVFFALESSGRKGANESRYHPGEANA